MHTIYTSHVSADQFTRLEDAAAAISPELHEVVRALYGFVRDGAEITAINPSEQFTPNEAAARLGMSRTHLYKLLDRGEIEHDRVGRDRRIPAAALLQFEQRRQLDRKKLAERFAHHQQTQDSVVDELSDPL